MAILQITELTLKLQGIPESISAAICSFPSVENAVRTVIQTIQMGIPMARMELVDSQTIEACNDYFNEDMHVSPHLFLEFHGSEDAVNEQSKIVSEIAESFSGSNFKWSSRQEERNKLWKNRHNAFYAVVPEALVAAIPPSEAFAPGSTGKNKPLSFIKEFKSSLVTPGCITTSISSELT